MAERPAEVAALVIGRNEGVRLERCLASLKGVATLIYVDSGSDDDSVNVASAAGADVVRLDDDRPFTAARARNSGVKRLKEIAPDLKFVQFVDGDCEIAPGWLGKGVQALLAHSDVAIVCGRRREKYPEHSVYNRFIDREWDTPTGETTSCGGDSLGRVSALELVDGFRDDLICGEEPELCFRLRRAGWKILRIPEEMTSHDANVLRFGQWWRRTVRTGYGNAEGVALHGRSPELYGVRATLRALTWGMVLPGTILVGSLLHPRAMLLTALYPIQFLRLMTRENPRHVDAWSSSLLLLVGKFAEAVGAVLFVWRKVTRGRSEIIEYRDSR